MLATVIATIVGAIVTGVVVWIRGWFSAKVVDKAIGERIEAVEAQAEVDRKKRLDDLNAEANKIIANDDAAAAIALLREKFPGTNVSSTNS